MRPHVLYLHGFGSGPLTAKGVALGRQLTGLAASYSIPELDGGDFPNLTMDLIFARALAAVERLPVDGAPVVFVGSSLGGYSAAWLAAAGTVPRLAGCVLIAPAFSFARRWSVLLGDDGVAAWRRDGQRPFFHHHQQREVPLKTAFLDSCARLPDAPGQARDAAGRPLPLTIVHGRQDETVDHRVSLDYAGSRAAVDLHLIDGDHRLTAPRHEHLIAWAVRDLIARI